VTVAFTAPCINIYTRPTTTSTTTTTTSALFFLIKFFEKLSVGVALLHCRYKLFSHNITMLSTTLLKRNRYETSKTIPQFFGYATVNISRIGLLSSVATHDEPHCRSVAVT